MRASERSQPEHAPSEREHVDLATRVTRWIHSVRGRAGGAPTASDLDQLEDLVRLPRRGPRQRLLYLHALTPSISSKLVGGACHEPIPGGVAALDPLAPPLPYDSVHDAIIDGWIVVHFPQQRASFDDREIDVLGYEFILQKVEEHPAAEVRDA